MVVNTCTPTSVFGPLDQTLFLGCSILNFTSTIGWNEQASEITIHIAEDPCAGQSRIYFDSTLTQRTTTDADIGFIGLSRWQDTNGDQYSGDQKNTNDTLVFESYDIIGTPAYFRLGDFEYAGIIQNFERLESSATNPSYSVKLISPIELLKNIEIIIGEYAGAVGSDAGGWPFNVINVFGYMESFGVACPLLQQDSQGVYALGDGGIDGATFGTPAGGYGGANINVNGMQWNQIKDGINVLLNSLITYPDQLKFSHYSRLLFRGPKIANYGLMPADVTDFFTSTTFRNHSGFLCKYLVDISELPIAPSYWRLNDVSVSLLEVISQICDDAGCDYYVELLPITNAGLITSGIAKFIKIRTVSRRRQPVFGQIQEFIDSTTGTSETKLGRELRNEVTTKFVIGGPKQMVYQANQGTDPEGDGQPVGFDPEADDMIIPYFGVDSNNNVIIPTKDVNDEWQFEASTTAINLQMATANAFSGSTVTIGEKELQMALGGFDSWVSWSVTKGTDISLTFASGGPVGGALAGIWDLEHFFNLVFTHPEFVARELIASRFGVLRLKDSDVDRDLNKVYDWVLTYARDFYGKKFQVRLPFTCVRIDSESNTVVTSEEPSDGGWTQVNNVIGLSHPSSTTDFFSLSDGRLGNFVYFNSGNEKDFSKFQDDDYIVSVGDSEAGNPDEFWVKTDVEDEFVYLTKSTFFSPRMVITLPQAVEAAATGPAGTKALRTFIDLLIPAEADGGPVGNDDARDKFDDAFKNVANADLLGSARPAMVVPDSAALAIKSNINTYGPWIKVGPAGGVSVEHHDGLVPWEYGSYANLNLAAQSIADENITQMQVGEHGSVTVPGYPTIPLGAELGAVAGGAFGGRLEQNLVENRETSVLTINRTHHTSGPQTFLYGFFKYPQKWIGLHGANITNITTEINNKQIKTSYQMATYAPKFGRMTKLNADRIKQIGQQQLELSKQQRAFIKERVGLQKISQQLKNIASDARKELRRKNLEQQDSPHQILVGGTINWVTGGSETRNIVSSMGIKGYVNEIGDSTSSTYSSKAFMSMDGLVRPISMDGDGNLPQYIANFDGLQKIGSKNAQPPFSIAGTQHYNIDIDVDYLNPFSNPSGIARSSVVSDYSPTGSAKTQGHDIDIIGRSSTPPASSIICPIEGEVNAGSDGDWDYQSDYRTFALRGPLMMQSWGYDIDNKPIPNEKDTIGNATVGTFVHTGLADRFLDGWLRQSKTWPVGPVDLRWDRARGCWVSPPSYRLVYGTVLADIVAFGTGLGTITSPQDLYDTDGAIITQTGIEVQFNDKVGNTSLSGDSIVAYYDVAANEYSIIETIASGGSGGISAELGGVCFSGASALDGTTITTLKSASGIIFSGENGILSIGADFHNIRSQLLLPGCGIELLTTGNDGPCDTPQVKISIDIRSQITAESPLVVETGAGDCDIIIQMSGIDGTFCFLTDIECSGGNVIGSGESLTFTNGLLTATGVC